MKKGYGMPVILPYVYLSCFILFGLMTVSGITGCGGGGDGGGVSRNYQLEKLLIEPAFPRAANIVFHASDMEDRGVNDLYTEDFIVYEDSQEMPQLASEMNVRKRDALPPDVSYTIKTVLLLDNSPSVASKSTDDNLQKIKDAATAMVEEIDSQQAFGVFAFSDEITKLVEGEEDFITYSNAAKITTAIYGLEQSFGTTDLYGSVTYGLSLWEDDYSATDDSDSLEDESESVQQTVSMSDSVFSAVSRKTSASDPPVEELVQGFLVLVTDGYHTTDASDFNHILDLRGGKRIFAVALGEAIANNGEALEQLKKLGNAGFYLVPDANNLGNTLKEIQRKIVEYADSFYWLQYKSPRTSSDPVKSFQITLEIRDNTNTEANNSITEEAVTTDLFFSEDPGVYINAIPSSDPNGITLDEYGEQIVDPVIYLEMFEEDTFELEATTYKPTNPYPDYVWEPDDSSIVQLEIDEDDSAKAIVVTAENQGETIITVSDTANNFLFAEIPVKVVLLDPPPILYYPFTGNADDKSDNDYHGEVFGAEISFDRTGQPGTAYSFDGINDYIAIDKLVADEEGGIAAITVCVWVKTASDQEQSIISFDKAENWALSMVEGRISWDTKDSDLGPTHSLVTEASYNDNNWHLVCAVFQAGGNLSKQIYVDGLLVEKATNAHDLRSLGTGIARFGIIGAACKPQDCATSTHFEGKIDEVYIYGRALSEDEVKFMYKATVWDEDPEAELSIDDVSVPEDAGSAVFTITVTPAISRYITVDYTTSDGTAIEGRDYESSSGTLTIAPGETEANIPVSIINDDSLEPDKNFHVILSNPLNACFEKDTGTATITNDGDVYVAEDLHGWRVYDNTPPGATITEVYDPYLKTDAIQFSGDGIENGYVYEGDDGGLWTDSTKLMVQWMMKSTEEVGVFFEVETTAGLRLLTYQTVDVDELEPDHDEYIFHSLGSEVTNGQWWTFVIDLQADLEAAIPGAEIQNVNALYIRGNATITDILFLESLTFISVDDVTVAEDVGSAVFTISLSEAAEGDISVEYTTVDNTAVAPDDYTSSEGTATIGDGTTAVNVSVPIIDDSVFDGLTDEIFFLRLSNAPEGVWIQDNTGIAAIQDNDIQPPTVYEDAEDGTTDGWSIYDDVDPGGAQIDNVTDDDRPAGHRQVIGLSGTGIETGYQLRNEDGSQWNNRNQFVIEWSIKTSEEFGFYVELLTTAGERFLYYTPVEDDLLGSDDYVHYGLGSGAKDGQWHTFVRDLQADLEGAQWGERVLAVNGISIRGDCRVDDIILYESMTFLSINDVRISEDAGAAVFTITASTTANSDITVDFATSDDTAEAGEDYSPVTVTATIEEGTNFTTVSVSILNDAEYELDESFFVILSNPVNAAIHDGTGVATITDNDPLPPTVYEDAEDGETLGWSVYDNNPSGAQIENIHDNDRLSRVIDLSGDGINNGYELRKENGTPWNNSTQFAFEWSMKCSEEVQIFVDVSTTGGQRFMYYQTVDEDLLGEEDYVHHGLGSDVMDGTWHTFVRNLHADLEDAQWDETILGVNGVSIRGNARVDDIKLSPITVLSVNDVTISEDGGSAVFTITSGNVCSSIIAVDYSTGEDTAVAVSDYEHTSGTATILAQTTSVNVSVPINEDGIYEGDETFYLDIHLSEDNPPDPIYVWIEDAQGVGTIVDNEPLLSINDVTVSEAGGSAQFTITASETAGSEITVDYITGDITAEAGSDYDYTAGTATISAGADSFDVSVPIIDDDVHEGIEDFSVILRDPSTNAGISDEAGEGTGTITDND